MNQATYNCPACQNEIGKLHPLADGLCLLDTGGGALASHYRGVCKQCDKPIFFDLNDQKFARLIKKIQDFKKEVDDATQAALHV